MLDASLKNIAELDAELFSENEAAQQHETAGYAAAADKRLRNKS